MGAAMGSKDKRNRCRAAPPGGRGKRPVVVHLSPDDYRAAYDLAMVRGVSLADTLRQLVREAAGRELEDLTCDQNR